MKIDGIISDVSNFTNIPFYKNLKNIPFRIEFDFSQRGYKLPDKVIYIVKFIDNIYNYKFAEIQKIRFFLIDENTYTIDYNLFIPGEDCMIYDNNLDPLNNLNDYYNVCIDQKLIDKIDSIELLESLK